jgi:hypothetical protein
LSKTTAASQAAGTAQPTTSDVLVRDGGSIKALGDGKVGGYLVLFTDETSPDLAGDFFTKSTDFDFDDDATIRSQVYYHHGQDSTLKARKFGKATLKMDEVGVWAEGQLQLRDEYEKAVYEMAEAGKLGWSSGTAEHLVEREQKGAATWIKRWPLGLDASLTPTPCEPRTKAVPLKSLLPGAVEPGPAVKAEAPVSVFKTLTAQIKAGQSLLGDWVGYSMTTAGFRVLQDALMYRISDVLCDDDGDSDSPDEKLSTIMAMFAEYQAIAKRFFGAMLASAEDADAGAKSLKTLWNDPEITKDCLASQNGGGQLTLIEHSNMALAAVEGWQKRLAEVVTLRRSERKSGRVISQANHARLRDIHETMSNGVSDLKDMIETTAPDRDNTVTGDETAKALSAAMEIIRSRAEANKAELLALTA